MLSTEPTKRVVSVRHAVAAAPTVALCLVTAGCAADRAESPLSPEEMLARAASTPVAATFEFDTTPGVPEGRYAGAGFMSGDDFEAELSVDDSLRKVGRKLYTSWDDEWAFEEAEPGLWGTGLVGPRAHLDLLALVTPTGDVDSEVVEDVLCRRIEFEYTWSVLAHLLDGRSVGDYLETEGPTGSGEV